MSRNFGKLDTYSEEALACPSSPKSGQHWDLRSDDHGRYKGFLRDLEEKFKAAGQNRKRISTSTVHSYVIQGYAPSVGIECARTQQKNIQWLPPTYEEYKTVWDWYASKAAAAGLYPDMRPVVQHFYEGRGPIATASATMVPTDVEEPESQKMNKMNTFLSPDYQVTVRRLMRQRGGSPSGQGQPTVPVEVQVPPQGVSISPEDVVPDEGMGLGLKIAIGVGVLGLGAFVARRQGWI